MTRNIWKLAAVIGLGLVLLHSAAGDALATSGGYASFIEVSGKVEKPGTYKLEDLKTLPVINQNVVFFSGQTPVSARYTGVLLWDFLQKVGIQLNPDNKNDLLRRTIRFIATDGYIVHISAGEIDPRFGGHQVILAYAQDGEPVGPKTGFARLVFPGDKFGGRAISAIRWIIVY